MKRIKVKPGKKDLVVLDAYGRQIPAEGCEVNKSVFILRLVKDGDLVIVRPKPKDKEKGGN